MYSWIWYLHCSECICLRRRKYFGLKLQTFLNLISNSELVSVFKLIFEIHFAINMSSVAKLLACSRQRFSLKNCKAFFAFCDVILSVEAIFLLRIECNGLVKYGHNVEDFMCSLCSSCYFNLFSKYLL